MTTAEDVLRASADAANEIVATTLFSQSVANTVTHLGRALVRCLSTDDSPGLLIPVDVVLGSKPRLGAVLILDDRVLVAWAVRLVKERRHVKKIPRESITGGELVLEDRARLGLQDETVALTTDHAAWRFTLAGIPGGRRLAPVMVDLLDPVAA